MEDRDLSRQNALQIKDDIFHKCRRRCFFLPCFDKSAGGTPSQSSTVRLTWWQKLHTAENESESSLWSRGLSALKKIREWSEIVAGPKWKTFIRRFNRDKDRHTNFRYDPLSYAMNFDEGNGHFEDEDEEGDRFQPPNFSARYAKSSIDFDNGGHVHILV
ncbi:uncharacterized protein LOC142538520 [Primulina tabacum]|uniref:uncharacterized protein LOC142538520 n=1 Tax=Primulina tabacum TaxID=48773 RepID=UPI003F5A316D